MYLLVCLDDPSVSIALCNSARTCSDCISISKDCKWCASESFHQEGSGSDADSNRPAQCSSHFSHLDCSANLQINPQLANIKTLANKQFSDSIDDSVQLRPQIVAAEARTGAWATISIDYKQAADYPMDLYYLMDLSFTMLKHRNSVSRMGKKLANKITTTTKDFRIGFGSFVDKESIPFANYESRTLEYQNTKLEYTHSFINHLPLSKDANQFEKHVINAPISGNLDSPEGTLDALMQVMVCDQGLWLVIIFDYLIIIFNFIQEIGWRPHSDKIIVVASDEEFHYAGDGKVGS